MTEQRRFGIVAIAKKSRATLDKNYIKLNARKHSAKAVNDLRRFFADLFIAAQTFAREKQIKYPSFVNVFAPLRRAARSAAK